MIFLYSRKSQFVLLLCWLIGMAVMYAQVTGERPLWLVKAEERVADGNQKVRLGHVPELRVQAAAPSPAPAPQPAPDPVLNRCLAMRVGQGTGEHADTLTLELDYIAA